MVESLDSLYQVTRELLWRGQHGEAPKYSKCRNKLSENILIHHI